MRSRSLFELPGGVVSRLYYSFTHPDAKAVDSVIIYDLKLFFKHFKGTAVWDFFPDLCLILYCIHTFSYSFYDFLKGVSVLFYLFSLRNSCADTLTQYIDIKEPIDPSYTSFISEFIAPLLKLFIL